MKVAEGRLGSSKVDVYAALLGAAFLVSAILAYVLIRGARYSPLSGRCERLADGFFMYCSLSRRSSRATRLPPISLVPPRNA